MKPLTVLVCGGRDYSDKEAVYAALDALRPNGERVVVLSGGAKGADELAEQWVFARGIMSDEGLVCNRFPADWEKHGRAAGPIRNQEMLDIGKPDLVLAFPGGRGTADMVRRAMAAGVPVRKIT